MAMLSKGSKSDNFGSPNSLKLSFNNIWDLRSNFDECKSFFEANSPDIFALCETNLDALIDSWHFLCEELSSFNSKGFFYLCAWLCYS